jgi:hypothetical protein
MGGSGGGGGSYSSSPDEAERLRQEVRRELEEQERATEINGVLAELLTGINHRDVDAARERLDAILESLADLTINVERLLFGGSVAKHTYVDGLSDVDALVVVRDNNVSPEAIVERFARALRSRLPMGDVQEVTSGALAVTVTYRDGTQIQLLPAVERDGRTSIAAENGREWRHIRPHKFAEKLTETNKANGNAVVPTIKLAKSLFQQLGDQHRLSGYHVEAMAVDAFKRYTGRRDRLSMLTHLIDHCSRTVLRPTGDITGQSVHIDSSLGPAQSALRRTISGALQRLSHGLQNAHTATDARKLFGD